jgi:glyoxylase-like metal-dependent hydrolase (beta-lactamase superfamily II)
VEAGIMGTVFIYIALFLFVFFICSIIYVIRSFKDPIGKTIQYDDNLRIFPGGGCNSIVLASEDGKKALIVDTKYFKGAKNMRNEVNASEIIIINTHFHMDHTRGNKLYPDAYVISGNCSWNHWDFDTGHSKRPDKVLNPGNEITITIGKEDVRIINMGSNHAATDCIVYLKNRKVLIAGDIIWNNVHPMVLDSNCNISSWIKILDKLESEFEIDIIIPGHGNISDKSSLAEMREYFKSIKNSVNNAEKLKQIREKYKKYKSVPVTNSLNKTIKKIRKEMK